MHSQMQLNTICISLLIESRFYPEDTLAGISIFRRLITMLLLLPFTMTENEVIKWTFELWHFYIYMPMNILVDIAWWRWDINFIFKWQKRSLTSVFLRRNHLDSSKLILAFSCSSVNSFMSASVNLTSLSLAIFQSTVWQHLAGVPYSDAKWYHQYAPQWRYGKYATIALDVVSYELYESVV